MDQKHKATQRLFGLTSSVEPCEAAALSNTAASSPRRWCVFSLESGKKWLTEDDNPPQNTKYGVAGGLPSSVRVSSRLKQWLKTGTSGFLPNSGLVCRGNTTSRVWCFETPSLCWYLRAPLRVFNVLSNYTWSMAATLSKCSRWYFFPDTVALTQQRMNEWCSRSPLFCRHAHAHKHLLKRLPLASLSNLYPAGFDQWVCGNDGAPRSAAGLWIPATCGRQWVWRRYPAPSIHMAPKTLFQSLGWQGRTRQLWRKAEVALAKDSLAITLVYQNADYLTFPFPNKAFLGSLPAAQASHSNISAPNRQSTSTKIYLVWRAAKKRTVK